MINLKKKLFLIKIILIIFQNTINTFFPLITSNIKIKNLNTFIYLFNKIHILLNK